MIFRSLMLFLSAIFFPLLICHAQNMSGRMLFDDHWKFQLGDSPTAGRFEYPDQNWRSINLPHDWSIEGKIEKDNPSGGDGGFFPTGIGWYRKVFTVPKNQKGKNISIDFEGIYMDSEVFINGISLGKYPYGYSGFSYNITPHLRFGGKNVISVKVNNGDQKNSRWYSGSGIYRHVWLTTTDLVHVEDRSTFITTPEADSKHAVVKVRMMLVNQTDKIKEVTVSTTIADPNGGMRTARESNAKVLPHSKMELIQDFKLTDPKLWSSETPHLYQANISLFSDQKISANNHFKFGVRSIAYNSQDGFLLNGKSIKLNGGCVHHDNGCLGAAAYDRAEERKVELLKLAGFNAVRTSHNPPSEAFLSACDRLGLMVIDEAFDGWRSSKNKYDYSVYFDQWATKDLSAMVLRDRNHPSVVMWSIGNEIIERKESQAVETARLLVNTVKVLDQTRPVTSAMTTWDNDWEIFDPLMREHDISGYNYQLHRAQEDHRRVPNRVILQTESYPRDAFTNWKLVTKHPYVIGDFVWTAMDYLGESGIGRWYHKGEPENFHSAKELFPWHGAYCGDVDLTGWRKPISHYRSMLYNNEEKIYLAVREPDQPESAIRETGWSVWPTWESWTWPGMEGKPLEVEVYSKYPSVRLYLNKKLLEERPTTVKQEHKAIFKVPFSEGEIVAVGVENGIEMEKSKLHTAGKAVAVRLKHHGHILANGHDLAYINIEIADDKGVINPNAENLIQFTLDGPGEIIGVDNGNLKDPDPYVATQRKAWKGRALLIVRSSKIPGNIKVKASSSGLTVGDITISSQTAK